MRFNNTKIIQASVFLVALLLSGCGGNSGGGTAATAPTYTIGGTLTGLTGTGLVLQNNAADDLAVSADGAFTFVTPSAAYAVTVKTQPGNPLQTCTVNSGSGTASANVTGVTVACSTNAYTVSGTVSGLAGTGLVLQDNSGDDLTISANGAFTFAASVASGANYNVTIKTQPTLISQTCTVTNGSGAVSGANIGGVAVSCVNPLPRFAYVANSNDNTVAIYTVNVATGQLRHNGYVLTGTAPQSVTVDPTSKFAYVTNYGDGTVSAYTINSANGALTAGSTVTAGTNPHSVTVHPSGKFAYVANTGSGNVSQYNIATDGALTQMVAASVPAGTGPVSVTVDPSGRFAYVASTSGSVSAYTIHATSGELTSAGAVVPTGTNPQSVAIDPSGRFAYVANRGGGVSVYTIDQSTGVLTPGTPILAGVTPQSVIVHPAGKFVYVANEGDNNVSIYSIDQTTGALTGAGLSVFAGTWSRSVTIEPTGKFLYVANLGANTVSIFSIDQSTGALTLAGNIATRSGPISINIAAGSTGVTYKPKFAYVATAANSISIYGIDTSTGALTSASSAVANAGAMGIEIEPSGRFAYVTNNSGVTVYGIDANTGTLAALGGVGSVTGPYGLAIDPAGKFAYVADNAGDKVAAYTIDATTGQMTAVPGSPYVYAVNSMPSSVAVDPSGRFAYVAYQVSGIHAYTINPIGGGLSEVTGSPYVSATSINDVTVHPGGRFVYAANWGGNGVSAYSIDPATGALLQIDADTATAGVQNYPAGTNPASIVITPSGKYAYVANDNSRNISAYSINQTTGELSPVSTTPSGINNIRAITVDPSGKFVYIASLFTVDSKVAAFLVDEASGNLSSVGTTSTGGGSNSMTTLGVIE